MDAENTPPCNQPPVQGKTSSHESQGYMCCVFGCNSRQYSSKKHSKRKLNDEHFFSIPKQVLDNKKLKDRWCQLIKRVDGRDGFSMTARTKICSKHFQKSDISISDVSKRWILNRDVLPSIFNGNKELKLRKPPKQRYPLDLKVNVAENFQNNDMENVENELYSIESEMETNSIKQQKSYVEKSCQTDTTNYNECLCNSSEQLFTAHNLIRRPLEHDYHQECENLKVEIKTLERKIKQLSDKIVSLNNTLEDFKSKQFCIEKISDDNKAVAFYTGFPNIDSFEAFYRSIEKKADKLTYWRGKSDTPIHDDDRKNNGNKKRKERTLTIKEELFMFLVRIKVGLFVRDIADRFDISMSYFSKIFTTWVNFLSVELPLHFPFPSQALIRKNMPLEFEPYPSTRIILDCTEIFVEVPSSTTTQSETWSNYKHHNTFKVLVGVSPNGTLTFVSELWGGRVSDKEITLKSGVLDLMDKGDSLMCDRGFLIHDILPEGVGLNIPPFLGARDQLTAEEVEETSQIASVRIHVEREIGRIKNYHILDGVMPLSLAHVAGHIFKVCAFLTNYLPPLLVPASKANVN